MTIHDLGFDWQPSAPPFNGTDGSFICDHYEKSEYQKSRPRNVRHCWIKGGAMIYKSSKPGAS